MRSFVLAVLLTTHISPALAQGTPSADEITRGLQPRGGGVDRGIRRADPGPQPSASPATQPAVRAQPNDPAPPRAPSVNLSVLFRTGSADLTPTAQHTLDELGKALSDPALAPYRFRIEGHTDAVGAAAANRLLSERRAAVVVNYLNVRFGVDRARLEAVGMGGDAPLVPTGPQVPEPRNRRVQVVNIGA